MKKSTIALIFALGLATPFTAVTAASAETANDGQATAQDAQDKRAVDVRQNEAATLNKLRRLLNINKLMH